MTKKIVLFLLIAGVIIVAIALFAWLYQAIVALIGLVLFIIVFAVILMIILPKRKNRPR